jgi:hypothetical protein
MVELTGAYNRLATETFDYFGTGLVVAFLYLLLGLPFARLARFVEERLGKRGSGIDVSVSRHFGGPAWTGELSGARVNRTLRTKW